MEERIEERRGKERRGWIICHVSAFVSVDPIRFSSALMEAYSLSCQAVLTGAAECGRLRAARIVNDC